MALRPALCGSQGSEKPYFYSKDYLVSSGKSLRLNSQVQETADSGSIGDPGQEAARKSLDQDVPDGPWLDPEGMFKEKECLHF